MYQSKEYEQLALGAHVGPANEWRQRKLVPSLPRSTNNTTFTQVGTSSSTTYIDAGLTQQTYYKVAAW